MAVDIPAQIAHNNVARDILEHFSKTARVLPWRNPPGAVLPLDDPNWPYRVWLSEIMLQQTTVAAVIPYFERFTSRWPSVAALAAADDADVMAAWAGLGYYARARNLLACARAVVAQRGAFPGDEAELRALPGVGAYTAAAIAAFAFGKRAVVVDGNIQRVVARLFAIETPMPAARREIYAAADMLTPQSRAGDFAQGLMDLGRSLCLPRAPRCLLCPVADACCGKQDAERYPVKPAKTIRPERTGVAWWVQHEGKVNLVRRPDKGLLGGMRGLPSGGWQRGDSLLPPCEGDWQDGGSIVHIFTHFRLTLSIRILKIEKSCIVPLGGEWWDIARLDQAGLPSLFTKAAARATTWEIEA